MEYVKVSKEDYSKLGDVLNKYKDTHDLDSAQEESSRILDKYGLSIKCVSIGDRIILNIRDIDTGEIVGLNCDDKYNKLS